MVKETSHMNIWAKGILGKEMRSINAVKQEHACYIPGIERRVGQESSESGDSERR